jgi:serine O-acetyltransferase
MVLEVTRDFRRVRRDRRPSMFWIVVESFRSPGFRAVLQYRIAKELLLLGVPILPSFIHARSIRSTGADIACSARIGPGLLVRHPVGIVIGGGTTIGRNCTIMQGVTLGESLRPTGDHSYPSVGDRVTLGAGSVCLGGVNIGNGSIVGANAVVTRSLPENVVVAGVPARVISRTKSITNATMTGIVSEENMHET